MTEGIRQRQASDEPWTIVQLKDRCRRVRNGVLKRSLASEAEVEALIPDEDAGFNAWVHAYAQLWRIYEREQFLRHGSEYATRHLLKALDSEPEELELHSGLTVKVYPKSEAALRWFANTYYWLNWFNIRHEAIREQAANYEKLKENGEEPLQGIDHPISDTDQILAETNYYVALIMWAACHEGPGLPWGYVSEPPDPEDVPSEWYDLATLDVQRIEAACHEVNFKRLQFLPKPKERGKGITPETFFAQRAHQTGVSVPELRRKRDLASEVAQVVLAGHREDAA